MASEIRSERRSMAFQLLLFEWPARSCHVSPTRQRGRMPLASPAAMLASDARFEVAHFLEVVCSAPFTGLTTGGPGSSPSPVIQKAKLQNAPARAEPIALAGAL